MSFIVETKPRFETYIRKVIGQKYEDFKNLKYGDKEKIFLRYKWGFASSIASEACENGRKTIMRMIGGREGLVNMKDEEKREYFEGMFEWEEDCYKIRQDIGITYIKPAEVMGKLNRIVKYSTREVVEENRVDING